MIKKILVKSNHGFTLVELLIVIALLSVLAIITIPRLTMLPEESRVQIDQTNARNLFKEIQANHLVGNLIVDVESRTDVTTTIVDSGISVPRSQLNNDTFTVFFTPIGNGNRQNYVVEIAIDTLVIFEGQLE